MYVHAVQMPALLYVPVGQDVVQVSMLVAVPTVFKYVSLLPVHSSCAWQAETRLSELEVQVIVASAAALVTGAQDWHVPALSQVPGAQVAVHVSMTPVAPMVFFEVAVAHAQTRESVAVVHVYVAPVAAPATVEHAAQLSAPVAATVFTVQALQILFDTPATAAVFPRMTAAALPTANWFPHAAVMMRPHESAVTLLAAETL